MFTKKHLSLMIRRVLDTPLLQSLFSWQITVVSKLFLSSLCCFQFLDPNVKERCLSSSLSTTFIISYIFTECPFVPFLLQPFTPSIKTTLTLDRNGRQFCDFATSIYNISLSESHCCQSFQLRILFHWNHYQKFF